MVVVLLGRVVFRSVSGLGLGRLVLVDETVPRRFEEPFVLVRICRRSTVARTGRVVTVTNQYASKLRATYHKYLSFPTFMIRLAVLSPISSANTSRIVRWFSLRYFGI